MPDDPPARVADRARLTALHRSGLLDTDAEEAFDRLTRLASRALGVPVSLVSLVDVDRLFIKSEVGVQEPFRTDRVAPLSISFCQHVVGTGLPLVVEDARRDPVMRDNPAVLEHGVIAYAGVPLLDEDGHILGSMCALDGSPRTWSAEDMALLTDVSAAATSELRLRVQNVDALRAAAIVNASGDAILAIALDDTILTANPAAERVLGWPPEDLVGRPFADLVPADRTSEFGEVQAALEGGTAVADLRSQRTRRDGSLADVSMSFSPITDEGDGVLAICAVIRDIGPAVATAERLRQAEARLDGAFGAAPVGMGIADIDGRFTRVNAQLCEMSGYSETELLGFSATELSHPDDLDIGPEQIGSLLTGESPSVRLRKRYVHKDGHPFWVDVGIALVHDAAGRPLHYVTIWEDVTERVEHETRLMHLASHDPLTGVANRRHFTERLEAHLARGRRYGARGCVLLLDLDDFKAVNDTMGHRAGDDALVTVADTLTACLRESDVLGRIGGDEFAVLLPEAGDADAAEVADKLVGAVRAGLAASGPRMPAVGVSIGIAPIREATATVDGLLARADLAMYEAKRGGRGRGWTLA